MCHCVPFFSAEMFAYSSVGPKNAPGSDFICSEVKTPCVCLPAAAVPEQWQQVPGASWKGHEGKR